VTHQRHGSEFRGSAASDHGDAADRRKAAFDAAQRQAAQAGLPDYNAWRAGLERRYTVMPPWYWNESLCRQNYIAHIRAAIDWQQQHARLNRGNAAFQRILRVPD
jgi:hypothetical protein